mmetsp:Transcript_12237/g.44644  ORF Transcript_12237/g.44644 Transcript_12237/m.44644 type:complete len:236 (+) Transcript_12237:155-862(+)
MCRPSLLLAVSLLGPSRPGCPSRIRRIRGLPTPCRVDMYAIRGCRLPCCRAARKGLHRAFFCFQPPQSVLQVTHFVPKTPHLALPRHPLPHREDRIHCHTHRQSGHDIIAACSIGHCKQEPLENVPALVDGLGPSLGGGRHGNGALRAGAKLLAGQRRPKIGALDLILAGDLVDLDHVHGRRNLSAKELPAPCNLHANEDRNGRTGAPCIAFKITVNHWQHMLLLQDFEPQPVVR